MGCFSGPEAIEDNLTLALDAANTKSYPSSGGSTWYDLSGKGNNGTISGATHTSGVGGYFDFDTGNDYVSFSNDSFVSNGGATLEFWFNVDTLSVDRTLINHSGFSYFNLLRTSNNKLRLEYKSTSANNTQLFTTSTISAETWYHVVGVVDNTGAKIYIDGELDASNTTPQNLGTVSSTLYVGSYSTSQYFFDGKIAMVKRYDKPLTAAEVKQNYNALRTREFLSPLPESFWEHTTNYYQGATSTVFPYSWYPASSSGVCADATVGPTFSPSRSGTQSFYHQGGAGSRVCIEESTDGGSTWTNIIDNNTQTTTFTLTYVGGRQYRFKMNVLGGPGAGAGVQVLNWHYTYTSPSNYRVMGIRSAHTDTNG